MGRGAFTVWTGAGSWTTMFLDDHVPGRQATTRQGRCASSEQVKAAEFSRVGGDLQATGDTRGTDERGALALLGGVFDPVHRGHLEVAAAAREALPVAGVVFLPAGLPPHKSMADGATPEQRLAMLELALTDPGVHDQRTREQAHFRIDPRELTRQGPSYTVLTLRELRDEAPERRLYFILGADNIPLVGGWYEAREFLELCTPVVFPRPGAPARFLPEHLPWLGSDRLAQINACILDVTPIAISSSKLRKRIAAGENTGGALPSSVAAYIREHGLYSGVPCNPPPEH